uniref:Polyketide synthase n=1 Tax=Pestalotiopsis microspora TaxID=85828 RepID=A0A1P8NTH8_PESMI|nr:polyketide synthase [Pestalotiopsis microspora]
MAELPPNGPEPIAIIGIGTDNTILDKSKLIVRTGCRMPGGVKSPSDFWKLLMSKGIAKSNKVPKSRYNIDAYLHPDNDRPGSFNVPGGYFLEDNLEAFDPSVFNISPVEALWMDPQQRKLLEVVFEAFESSGTSLDDVAGQKTGCYIGCFSLDFQFMTMKESDFRHSYTAMGVDTGILANRVSHVFDLKGPSITLNTACSSSLYALDLACKAIASGECDTAIVGGTNLMLTVDQQMNTAKMGVLSPNNQSRPFDELADGYGRAEGIGALYLKPLSAALRDGDPIRSVIRSTATSSNGFNQDGISRPSVQGQTDVISLAYKLGRLSPEETSYIECHGTGTTVGDPIEVTAIHKAMGVSRVGESPVLIGSVKPNVGHSEAASSIATLIKATLALESGIIPPTAGLSKLSSRIPWDQLNVQVVTEPAVFPNTSGPRRIGVNAFGYGGTNAHAILESIHSLVPDYRAHKLALPGRSDSPATLTDNIEAHSPHLLVFSAHSKSTLVENIADISSSLAEADIVDLAYTLGTRRTKFNNRTFAITHKRTFASDVSAATAEIQASPKGSAVPAFVFTGQGAQWPQMGATLLKTYPSVSASIRQLDRHLSTLKVPPTWTIEDTLLNADKSSLVNEPEYSQPLCTAIQIALVDLLSRWGVKPVATVGHSSGELGAAYAAGAISAESAVTAAYFRGKVAASLRADGAMLAVGVGAKEAQRYVDASLSPERVAVACHNSPGSTTLSGDRGAIEELKAAFDAQGIFARILQTGGKAYHSYHMREAASRYLEYLRGESVEETTRISKIPMFSTVQPDCTSIRNERIPDSYWVSNLVSPVLFDQGIRRMLSDYPAINTLIEVGPHSTLSGPLRQICQAINKGSVAYLPTLMRKENDVAQLLRLAGNLWAQNSNIDLKAVTGTQKVSSDGSIIIQTGSFIADLPTYHWTYTNPAFAESRASKEHRGMKEPRHDILGRRVIGSSILEPTWRNVLRQRDLPWLAQHKLAGEVMLPAAGYLALAIEAVSQINSQAPEPLEVHSYTMRNVEISTATVVPDDDAGTETIFRLRPMTRKLDISSDEAAHGLVGLNIRGRAEDHKSRALPKTPYKSAHLDWLDKERELGIDLGPAFHHISDVFTDRKTHIVRGDMKIARDCGLMAAESRYVLHPTVIDSCLQPLVEMMHKGHLEDMKCGVIPTYFGEATIFPPSADQLASRCVVQQWSSDVGNRSISSNVQLIAHDGALLVDMSDSRCLLYRAALPQELQGNLQRDLYMQLDWDVDADYLEWANDAGVLSGNVLGNVVVALLHKDAATRVLCLDTAFVPDLLVAKPDLRMSLGVSKSEMRDDFSRRWGSNDQLMCVDLETLFFGPEGSQTDFSLVISSADYGAEPHGLEKIRGVMPNGGHLLLHIDTSHGREFWDSTLRLAGFSGVDQLLSDGIIKTTARDLRPSMNGHHDNVEGPFLAQLEERDLSGLIRLTEGTNAMTWVTSGGLLKGNKPEFGMTAGAARTLRNEKGSLDLVTLDFDETTTEQRVADLLADIADRQRRGGRNGETEYYVQNGVAFIGRLVPHRSLNREFVPDSGELATLNQCDRPAVEAHLENGSIVYRRADGATLESLDDDEVEVHVGAIGLSELDGADDSAFLSHEMVGEVTRVGSRVQNLVPGMAVFGFALDRLSTFQRTSAQLLQPLPNGLSLTEAASLPSTFATAIYGLEELARVQGGETVVILDHLGAVGLAAVQLCHAVGARAIVVTSSTATEAYWRNSGKTFPQVILIQNGSLSNQLREVTQGRGVDIVFSSASADEAAVIECCRSLALFGRLVVSCRENTLRVAISTLLSGTPSLSFFQFDLETIIRHRPQAIAATLERCLKLCNDDKIGPLDSVHVKEPSDINKTIQSFPSDMGSGKFVANYDHNTVFKVAAASDTVRELKDRGVEALALRANITDKDELARAVAEVKPDLPIRGVVNAASIFRDMLFDKMSLDAWKDVADTKVKGSLNLHEVLKDEPLDFFVMTSSVASTLGSSGQANYSAANSFLDSLARHRHALGLPAISLILPAIFGIGHIADNPELEKAIQMKGMYGIRENEMLDAFEVAMTPQVSLPPGVHHMVVGLQPRRFGASVRAVGAHVLTDEHPQLNWVATTVEEQFGGDNARQADAVGSHQSIISIIQQSLSEDQAVEAVTPYLSRRLGRLLLIDEDSIQPTQKSVASHGLDSMIGAEFRNWVFREFKVDVPFQQLLAGSLTISDLARMLCKKVVESIG